MSALAEIAGVAGNVSNLKRVLDKIVDTAKHDQAASKSAIALAQSGNVDGAMTIAERIRNKGIQDDTLGQISKVE